jgi:tetratricopeptide (TPR) repeat protein
MKVAVYSIALNEQQFVDRWADSAKDADLIVLADTGSSDLTRYKAFLKGLKVVDLTISPWRFDDARNAALAAIPKDFDYCIALDMDEILLPGWREELEKAHAQGITRPRYTYTWNWKDAEETVPGLQYGGDKIHARHGYRWKHPVHETLTTDRIEETQDWFGLEIHHHPDNTKSRGQYFPLLEVAVKEDLTDDRNSYYLAREYFFNGMYDQAAAEFKRHLSLPKATWAPERAASMRYLAKCEPMEAQLWLEKAVKEAPGRREALVEAALWYYKASNWNECYGHAKSAVAIAEKPLDYLCEEFAWSDIPWDLLAVSAYNLKKYEEAVVAGKKALKLNPNDGRLKTNLMFYKEALKSK